MIRSAAWLGTPASHSLIGGTDRPSSNTVRALLGIEPGTAPPMSSWWPKACTNATTSPLVEDRHGHAQVGQVADAALRLVDVVVEEHVALAHLGEREVADDRVHQRGVRAAGELAQLAVVDAGAEVVRVADHRASATVRAMAVSTSISTLARVPCDDLDEDRVDRAALGGEPVAVLVCRGQAGRVRRVPSAAVHGGLRQASLVTTRLPNASTRTVKPGWTGTVEPNSSTTAGPAKVSPARRSGRQ